jgi:hypothetical protein
MLEKNDRIDDHLPLCNNGFEPLRMRMQYAGGNPHAFLVVHSLTT